MIQIKKILVATDFSEHSDNALLYAAEFAKAFDAEVTLCHVVESSDLLSHMPPGGEGYFPPNLDEQLQEKAKAKCEELLSNANIAKSCVRVEVGSPFVEIVRLARETATDLVIVGTHGRGPVAHLLLGSVAERVVRKAPCAVLTVRHGEHEFVLP